MSNFFLFGLALVIFGAVILSHVSGGLTVLSDVGIGRVAYMTSGELNDSNAVEVDGIRFQSIMTDHYVDEQAVSIPEKRVFTIPAKPDGKTFVYMGLRITNNTNKPVRFARFGYIIPSSLVGPNGEVDRTGGGYWSNAINPAVIGSVLAMPGKSINLLTEAEFFWRENNLKISFAANGGDYYFFDELKPGKYRIQLTYDNRIDEVELRPEPQQFSITGKKPPAPLTLPPEPSPSPKPKEVWKGTVTTRFVEFRLVR